MVEILEFFWGFSGLKNIYLRIVYNGENRNKNFKYLKNWVK